MDQVHSVHVGTAKQYCTSYYDSLKAGEDLHALYLYFSQVQLEVGTFIPKILNDMNFPRSLQQAQKILLVELNLFLEGVGLLELFINETIIHMDSG